MKAVLFVLAASVCLAQETTAEKLIEAGHWKRARSLVERRLREAPDDPNAVFLSSQIRNAFGDHDSPLRLAEQAVRLDAGTARYHRQLAEVQGVMAQRAGVFRQLMLARRFRQEIDTALRLDPRDVQALRDLTEFYLLAPGLLGGDLKKAETVAQQIRAIDPAEGFLAGARIAEFQKDQTRTETLLRHAAEVRPLSYKAQIALGRFYLAPEHRNDSAAMTSARIAIGIDSTRVDAHCILAVVYAGHRDRSELEAVLTSAAHEVPDDATPYYRAAERLLDEGRDPAQAERYLRLYLAQETEGNEPSAADAHWKLGLALQALGQDANAAREWKSAVRLDPASPAALELKRTRAANANGGSHGAGIGQGN